MDLSDHWKERLWLHRQRRDSAVPADPVGNLIAFEPSDKEFKQLASYKVAEGDTTAYPVLAGNQIFVKDRDSVTLWTVD